MIHKNIIHRLMSVAAVSAAFLGVGAIVNAAAKPQTVQAATRNRIINKVSAKMIRYYVHLAKRSGTHYFSHKAVSIPTLNDYGVSYNMNGKDKQINNVFGGSAAVIGTKTIGSKHYFIIPGDAGHPFARWSRKESYLMPTFVFSLPTAYQVKAGHKIPLYMGADKHTSDGFTITGEDLTATSGIKRFGYIHAGERFIISSPAIKQDFVNNHGTEFASTSVDGGCARLSDIKKNAKKYTGKFADLGTYKNGKLTYFYTK